MKKNIFSFIALLSIASIFFILFLSCNREDSFKHSENIEVITEEQTKEVYANADEEIFRRFSDRYFIMPRWDGATELSLGPKHNARYIPIGYNDSSGNFLQMIVMKDEGRVRSLLIEMQPDENWLMSNRDISRYENMTGKLLFYSANGRFYQGFTLKDGAKVNDYYPTSALSSTNVLYGTNSVLAVTAHPCTETWGSFGCEELAQVLVIARTSSTSSTYVFIYIPSNVYNSNPQGGTYNGYPWKPVSGASIPLSPNMGGAGGGPGDRLCSSSFQFTGSSQRSFWNTNMVGLRFESGSNVNNLPTVKFLLYNGITDAAMRSRSPNDYLGRGKTRLEYLEDQFESLFSTNNITSEVKNGQTLWYFTNYAAGKIASFSSNLAAIGVSLELGNAASFPNNTAAWSKFYTGATNLLDCYIPGARVQQGALPNTGTSYANFSTTCQ